MDAHKTKTEVNHEELMAIVKASGKGMEALIYVSLERRKPCLGKTEARLDTWEELVETEIKTELEEIKAKGLEANSEETEAVAEHQKVLKDEAAVELGIPTGFE